MSVTSVNGKPFPIALDSLPPIDVAMRIIEGDLHREGSLAKLQIREVFRGIYYGRMYEEIPEGFESEIFTPGQVVGEITAHATTRQDVVRQLAALIMACRGSGART